jgi:hypothetical protein
VRSAVEPVIGHLKSEHRIGRNYLWHRAGDAANAVLAAAGCNNFRRLIRWLQLLLSQILVQLTAPLQLIPPETQVLHQRPNRVSDKSDLIAFQDKTCQSSGHVGTRIDVDTVWSNVRLEDRRVSVHDNFAKVALA